MPDERPYRVYKSSSKSGKTPEPEWSPDEPSDRKRARDRDPNRPYKLYRAAPRGLLTRLRAEEETAMPRERGRRRGATDAFDAPVEQRQITRRRVFKWIVLAICGWLLLSLVLFLLSAQIQQGSLPSDVSSALSSGPNMLFGTDTILVVGTDQRPKGSKEPGANTSDTGSRSDTMMLWRIGGGTSRRLSIPRDTVAAIPGHGTSKINAAYAYGGPALTIRTVEQFTGVKINHLIVINLANFPKFIDAIGGIDVKTGRVCSNISGGVSNGGFTLNLRPGVHHLNGRDALTLARTRHNTCNPAASDLTRVQAQQQILNAIKSKLLSVSTFWRLPLASWTAPEAIRSDMNGFTLMSLFAASELGGSAPVSVLKPTGSMRLSDGESALTVTPGAVQAAVSKLMNG